MFQIEKYLVIFSLISYMMISQFFYSFLDPKKVFITFHWNLFGDCHSDYEIPLVEISYTKNNKKTLLTEKNLSKEIYHKLFRRMVYVADKISLDEKNKILKNILNHISEEIQVDRFKYKIYISNVNSIHFVKNNFTPPPPLIKNN